MKDIYFEDNYGKLYENHEQGVCKSYVFKNNFGQIKHMFIKREIPVKINGEIYYDLVTPYGYGGPIITECQQGLRENLVREFIDDFQCYCKNNNIVSEFVRFHPILENVKDFNKYYSASHIRNTVGTNLSKYDDPFQSEFSRSCRKNIRKAIKNNVTYRIKEKPNDVSEFREFYFSTMDRNNAADYYYFDEEYFNLCVKYFKENLLLVEAIYQEQPIAMGLYFIYGDLIHIHLSGTLSEYLHLSPAYILRYAVTEWGKENGYDLIHHGGGRTNDQQDGLYTFKKRFGANTEFDFHIGKKIWNEKIYNQLCEKTHTKDEEDFFPAYRKAIAKDF